MTNQEKLQKLFEAALKSQPEDYLAHPLKNRAVPASPALEAHKEPAPPPAGVADQEACEPAPANRTMSAGEAEELGILLDEQIRRRRRRHRMEALVTALVLLGMTVGGLAWFVRDPSRVQAFQEAMRDIRSVGDIKSLVASYQNSLDRISARSNQIDGASMAMGIDPSNCADEDPYMEAEMKEMMGGEGGQTVGSRNQRLMENFGHMAEKNGVDTNRDFAASETAKKESFDWK
jgi:hypothetical protein